VTIMIAQPSTVPPNAVQTRAGAAVSA
jgi:hypothetical protein